MAVSEVTEFRKQQALQEQAAYQGLYGLAMVARHETITARMERGSDQLFKLFEEGKQDEAIALCSTETWC